MVKLDPSPEQHKMLCETMKRFNEACNDIAEIAFAMHSANKIEVHKKAGYTVRERFGLSSQLTVRAISKVCEAYDRDKSIKPEFRLEELLSMTNISSPGEDLRRILWLHSRAGKLRIGEYQKARLERIRGQADLILVNGIFSLCAAAEVADPSPYGPLGVLGVDLGIKYLALYSDGEIHCGEKLAQTRDEFRCESCGFAGRADHAMNIAFRAAVNQPVVAREHITSAASSGLQAGVVDETQGLPRCEACIQSVNLL
ncbi:MAG: hypothetical protein NQU42_04180 [Methanothrix sp.]|uniref:hypothetical protein n=1 Tax=Methanothrix sp. TaxID=90426 RepID=UPI0025F81569|nr:hypothetical protein [Methanothrix sp.]MCQ8903275.1 hypothetical protein [Methanothrix sp.]